MPALFSLAMLALAALASPSAVPAGSDIDTSALAPSRLEIALRSALAEADKARRADVETLRAELARAVAPSALAKLEAWTHSHAIFFTKDTGYRDPAVAAAALDELAKLIKDTDVLVRVVGFTDEKGGQERNVPLSLARANQVASELQSRGIPAARLVAVGRNNIEDLSPVVGDASPNRRVEFEIGFDGEAAR